jgi:NAD(P)-dependent dehydrogenase (short-subunit alcohol dehydrogenase family)
MPSRHKVAVDGRTAYISGAASGIGRAIAQRLAAHGCPVAIVDQDEAGLAQTADLIGGPVVTRRLDVRDRQAQMAFRRRGCGMGTGAAGDGLQQAPTRYFDVLARFEPLVARRT